MKRHLWLTIGATVLFYFEAGLQAQPAYQRGVSAIPATDPAGPAFWPTSDPVLEKLHRI
ncbi:MAG: hypothetical protein L0196_03700 [candidate division Zixibacteria bacterium]|nr:hypothetical protein [candidate division Zixibacteria bacterium]